MTLDTRSTVCLDQFFSGAKHDSVDIALLGEGQIETQSVDSNLFSVQNLVASRCQSISFPPILCSGDSMHGATATHLHTCEAENTQHPDSPRSERRPFSPET